MKPAVAALGLGLLLAGQLQWAIAAPAAGAGVTAEEPITLYRTLKGDTVEGLAARYMTGWRDAALVERLSGVSDPTRMAVGTVLRIPTRLLRSEPLTLTVLAVTGPVTRSGGAASTAALTKGDLVREGDRVSTGANAFATLAQADGSRVALPSHTVLRVALLRRTLLGSAAHSDFVIESGKGGMTVTPLRSPSDRFEIRTPAAVAAVRGTEFRVGYDPSASLSTLEVTHGRVGESASDAGPAAEIATGFAAQRPTGGERTILPLPPAPALAPAPATRTTRDIVLNILDPRPGWRYHFVFARDAEFTEVFAEDISADGVTRLDPPAPGPVNARITAIDQHGVEGFAKTYEFKFLVSQSAPASGR